MVMFPRACTSPSQGGKVESQVMELDGAKSIVQCRTEYSYILLYPTHDKPQDTGILIFSTRKPT